MILTLLGTQVKQFLSCKQDFSKIQHFHIQPGMHKTLWKKMLHFLKLKNFSEYVMVFTIKKKFEQILFCMKQMSLCPIFFHGLSFEYLTNIEKLILTS